MADNGSPGDPWRTSYEHFTSAVNHSLNASRLMAAGTVALGMAATAYLWDDKRRDDFAKSLRGFTDVPGAWWGSHGGQDRGDRS